MQIIKSTSKFCGSAIHILNTVVNSWFLSLDLA